MKRFVYGLIVLLAIVHQDFWWWDRIDPLVLGFVPIGLAYQAGVSVVAAILWAMAVRYCWPAGLEEDTTRSDTTAGGDA
ncbi:MAG: DUF3311 domain-containing protein [Planctomycetes bacterium]|nr:DUF3311 domain-containing protein [Planctomycetota bacterium]